MRGIIQGTPTKHLAVGPTNVQGWGLWTTTAHRSWAWCDAHPVKSISLSATTPSKRLSSQVEADTEPTTLYTNESSVYNHIAETDRGHAIVCHSRTEWARDDDGDGIREVHCNTMEGTWTGLRNFLRPFRGVHKKFLALWLCSSGHTISSESHLTCSEV